MKFLIGATCFIGGFALGWIFRGWRSDDKLAALTDKLGDSKDSLQKTVKENTPE